MRKAIRLVICCLLVMWSAALYASATEAGGVFLTIFPGAKATALGAAFSAVADDATASYYNPGAMGFFKWTEFSLIHAPWLRALAPDMYYEFAGFVKPIGNSGVIGGHIIYLTLGELVAVKEGGEVAGKFRPYDLAVDLAYGTKLKDNLGFGVGAKFIYSFLAPGEIIREVLGEPRGGGSAMSFAFDAGLLYKPKKWLSVSAVLANIGPGLKYTETGDRDPLPRLIRLGCAFRPIDNKFHRLTISGDVNKILVGLKRDLEDLGISYVLKEAWLHAGIEYTYYDMISLRVGYFYDRYGLRKGITFGGGVKFKNFKLDIADDSKIYDFEESSNRRFSITYIMNK